MLIKNLFTKTSRDVPSDEISKNAQLLIRAGFVHKTMPGVYAFLPLGVRVIRNIEEIVRQNMDKIGGQETLLNMLHPKELWVRVDNRWDTLDILFRIKSQTGAEYALAQSNEEQLTTIAKMYISSWKDLPDYSKDAQTYPLAVYQIQTKFRDEIRSKAGLMRGREFRMKDMYDFHQNSQSQDAYYEVVKNQYLKIYHQMGLDAFAVRASGGAFSKFSHEFQVITEAGEDWTVLWSDGIKDNLEISKGRPTNTHTISLGKKKLRENLSDDIKSVQNHADEAQLETSRILKTVMFCTKEAQPQYLGVCIRGDLTVNEELVLQALEGTPLEGKEFLEATSEQMEVLGAARGRTTSITEIAAGYTKPVTWIFDKSIQGACGMVASLYAQVDVVRDCVVPYKYDYVAEVQVGFVRDDNAEIVCRDVKRSAEVGNIFKLGTKWTKKEAIDVTYTDAENQSQRPLMSCYGIGTTRCMGAIAEICCDDKGLKWPKSVAPFQYHLVSIINQKDDQAINDSIRNVSQQLYKTLGNGQVFFCSDTKILKTKGQECEACQADCDCVHNKYDLCLWDNRDNVGFGEKLKDADLIGCPIQVMVTKRSLEQGGVEVRNRETGESFVVAYSL